MKDGKAAKARASTGKDEKAAKQSPEGKGEKSSSKGAETANAQASKGKDEKAAKQSKQPEGKRERSAGKEAEAANAKASKGTIQGKGREVFTQRGTGN